MSNERLRRIFRAAAFACWSVGIGILVYELGWLIAVGFFALLCGNQLVDLTFKEAP